MEQFDKIKVIQHWVNSSDEDFETMITMFDSKRYSWSLFIGHLMLEKLLKAYYVKVIQQYPPYLHNLLRLATEANLEVEENLKLKLITITAFNLNARYDDYKNSFQARCTPIYTREWVEIIKDLRKWIKELIEK